MNSEWRHCFLHDIADIQTGPFGSQLHSSDYVADGIPSIMPQDIINNRIDTTSIARITPQDVHRLEKYCVQTGDIIYSRRGDVERHAIITEKENGWLCGTGCLRVRVIDSSVIPEYIHYYLTLESSRAWIRQNAHGTTMLNLNTTILGDIPICFPDYSEQKEIVARLHNLDAKIELNNQINENLQQQAQAIFKEEISKSKIQAPFTQYIRVLGGGTPKTDNPDYWNGAIPFFTPKDIGTPYVLETLKHITEEGLNNCNSRLYPVNTTFVTARGTVGKVSLAGVSMAMNQSCYALASDTLHPILVYLYALDTVESLKHKASGAVFDAIVTKDFNSEMVRVLPDESRVIGFLKPVFEKLLSASKETTKLVEMRDSLLDELMTQGERRD